MTSRELVKKTIKFERTDLIPVDLWILPATYIKYGKKLFNLLKEYPKDFVDMMDLQEENFILPPSHRKGDYIDCFGCLWHQEFDGFLGQIVKHPLEDMQSLDTYKFPPKEEGEITLEQIKKVIPKNRIEKKYFCADFIRTYERMCFLRGMENLLMDLAYQTKEFFTLLDKVVAWNISHLELVLEECGEDIDGIWFSDDWGSQSSLLISPSTWRKIFKPNYKKMFDVVKKYNKNVLFHSDGYILDIIDDLIELGVDVLNCQIKLLDAKILSKKFGGKITFHTDLDRQNILPYGTEEDIKNHIKDVIENLGKYSGGLILNAEIGPDMPYKNIVLLLEEFWRVRKL